GVAVELERPPVEDDAVQVEGPAGIPPANDVVDRPFDRAGEIEVEGLGEQQLRRESGGWPRSPQSDFSGQAFRLPVGRSRGKAIDDQTRTVGAAEILRSEPPDCGDPLDGKAGG